MNPELSWVNSKDTLNWGRGGEGPAVFCSWHLPAGRAGEGPGISRVTHRDSQNRAWKESLANKVSY